MSRATAPFASRSSSAAKSSSIVRMDRAVATARTQERSRQRLTIGVCSTYAPRACGLATFAADLKSALESSFGVQSVRMLAIDNSATAARRLEMKPDSAVLAYILEDDQSDYRLAARAANHACDVVVVEHEFGIFGGPDGEYVLRLLEELSVPVVLTLHTVEPGFSAHQCAVLRRACEMAAVVAVFTPTARELLISQQITSVDRVEIIPHGAPDPIYDADRDEARIAMGVEDRFVLATFGLVSPGKGLELAIEAMTSIGKERADALLLIAGQTHPEVRRREGERYRDSLVELAKSRGVEKNVTFIDDFLPVDRIAQILAATDLFVTPYMNPKQIVSGALTFALAAGCPIVSTPYQYATDQLASGAGIIVEDRDPLEFAAAVLTMVPGSAKGVAARRASRAIGSSMRWSAVGRELVSTCWRALDLANHTMALEATATRPAPSTRHLERLVDDTGIIQHATGVVPLLESGYCVDDVARLVTVSLGLTTTEPRWAATAARAVAFLLHAQRGPLMHNFMGWDRRWLDQPYFGDHVGRAFLALSQVADDPRYRDAVRPGLLDIVSGWPKHSALHTKAFALIGMSTAPSLSERDDVAALASRLIDDVLGAYERGHARDWPWFEPTLRYDNARLPHALIAAGTIYGRSDALAIGLQALKWYDKLCDRGSWLRFPGHLGLGDPHDLDRSGDEQPLEALALIEAHDCAFRFTKDSWHAWRAGQAEQWFYGANRLAAVLIDEDGGCYDGLEPESCNQNRGAESTLAGLAATTTARRLRVGKSSHPASVRPALLRYSPPEVLQQQA